MDNRKQAASASSSSFTDLFAPNASSSSSSSTGLFGSVFGPPSTGLRRDCSQPGGMARQDAGSQYGNGKHGTTTTSDNMSYRGKEESCALRSKDKSSIYQSEAAEPCYFSSSIYYGGQEVYSPANQSTASQHIFKKDGGDDPNGSNLNGASRGNWWQGSLYY